MPTTCARAASRRRSTPNSTPSSATTKHASVGHAPSSATTKYTSIGHQRAAAPTINPSASRSATATTTTANPTMAALSSHALIPAGSLLETTTAASRTGEAAKDAVPR